MLQMVATKHCCWGECKSDSRFPHLLHPALKKRLQEGKPIFLPFPKKSEKDSRDAFDGLMLAVEVKILP